MVLSKVIVCTSSLSSRVQLYILFLWTSWIFLLTSSDITVARFLYSSLSGAKRKFTPATRHGLPRATRRPSRKGRCRTGWFRLHPREKLCSSLCRNRNAVTYSSRRLLNSYTYNVVYLRVLYAFELPETPRSYTRNNLKHPDTNLESSDILERLACVTSSQ